LVHHPILDRQGAIVTTAITNIDLHDISRSALTFGARGLYVTHPIEAQRTLAHRIVEHWVEGSGQKRIPDRKPALAGVRIVETLEQAEAALALEVGSESAPEIWTTSAQPSPRSVTFADARERLTSPGVPVLLVFGTGWGLAPSIIERATVHLEPILGAAESGYNHLSVRAAAAIALDRLVGPRS
jgi:hypothetical protein